MATYVTLTIDAQDIIGADFDKSRCSAWIETNTDHGLVVVDGSTVRLGGRRESPAADGTITFANLVATNSADNPTSFGYRVKIIYTPKGSRKQGHDEVVTAEFPLTTSKNLADIPEAWDNITLPVSWRSEFRDEMEAIAGLTGEDAAIANRVNTGGSQTDVALKGKYAARGKVVPAANADTYGHSFMFGSTTGTGGSSTGVSDMATLIANGLDVPIAQHAVSGAALYTAASSGDWADVLQAEVRGTKFEPRGGAYAVMYGLNDAANVGHTYAELAPFKSALTAITARMRAAAVFENDDATMSGTGSWTTNTATNRNSGAGYAFTNSASVTRVWTPPADFPGGTVTAILPAYGDGGSATWQATVNGITYTVNTADYALTGNNPTVGVMRIPNVKRNNGAITFNVTAVSGSGAARAMWDCVMWEPAEAACPVVALIGQPKPLDYTSQSGAPAGPVTDAGVDVINQIIGEVVALFGERVVYVNTSYIDKNTNGTYWEAGNVHPNGAGHAYIATQTIAAIKAVSTIVPTSAKVPVLATAADAWTNYTPAVTGVTLGSGTILASYCIRSNGSVEFYVKVTLAADSAVTGDVTIALPTAAAAGHTRMGFEVFFLDNGTARYRGGSYLSTTSVVTVRSAGTNGILNALSSTSPFTWATSDTIELGGSYRKAA